MNTSSFTWHLYQKGPDEKYEYLVNEEGLIIVKLVFNDGIWAVLFNDDIIGEFITTKHAKIFIKEFLENFEETEETLEESK